MAIINEQRQQMIRMALTYGAGSIADVSVSLWERLAVELISVIGDNGFQALYARSIHLTSVRFPALVRSKSAHRSDTHFGGLRVSLEACDIAQASEASVALLVTFIDILTLLIGEQLTTSILGSAWTNDVVEKDGKELEQ